MGYYYKTTSTGEPMVDAIGAAIDEAGHAYHHTSDWNEKDRDGLSVVDHIDAALRNCADEIMRLRAVQDAREAVVRAAMDYEKWMGKWHDYTVSCGDKPAKQQRALIAAVRHLATLTATEGATDADA
jgi:hypothetical protein